MSVKQHSAQEHTTHTPALLLHNRNAVNYEGQATLFYELLRVVPSATRVGHGNSQMQMGDAHQASAHTRATKAPHT
jgi:hypothetical protein